MYPNAPRPVDRRKFEAELPNDLWQSDVMHGPKVAVDQKQRKSYLIALIDNRSRLVPHAGFYLSEKLDNLSGRPAQGAFKAGASQKALCGQWPGVQIPSPGACVCLILAIAVVHSKPYKPQGRGEN